MKSSVPRITFFSVIFCVLINTLVFGQDINKEDYEDKQFWLRKIINHSRLLYADPPYDTSMVFAQFDDKRVFLYKKDRKVSITKFKIKDEQTKIEIEYDSDITGKQKIRFVSPKDTEISKDIFQSLFNRIFIEDQIEEEYNYYALDTLRKKIHLRGCNHMSSNIIYASKSDLSNYTDYSLCISCFRPTKRIPNIDKEIALAQSIAAEYRKYNMVIVDDSLQNYCKKIGQRVLKNWPLELRGYDYNFIVVDNLYPNAVALPAGTIFIHSGLIKLCDDEKELEAVLAHEIGHVELRHGYRSLIKATKNKILGVLGTLATGIVVGLATEDSDAVQASLNMAESIGDIANAIALAGYSRESEFEADELATLYMYKNYNDQNNVYLKSMLEKMKYAFNETEYDLIPGTMDSHPATISRIITLKNLKFEFYEEPITFFGVDSLNREVSNIKFYYATSSSYDEYYDFKKRMEKVYKTTIYATIESTELLYETEKVKHFSIWYKGKRFNFDNKEDTPLVPLSEVSCVFVNESDTPVLLDELKLFGAFHLPLGPIRLWGKKEQ